MKPSPEPVRVPSALPSRLVSNARVLASRSDILPELPKGLVICEVGVALGDFSQEILAVCQPSRFLAVDIFTLHQYPEMWGGRVGRELQSLNHKAYYEKRFAQAIQAQVVEVIEQYSTFALSRFADGSVDIFYVDAHHSYESVSAELDLIATKITRNGLILVNDYMMVDHLTNTPYGVVQAVNEFMIREGWEMIYLALHSQMFCDVALRKAT